MIQRLSIPSLSCLCSLLLLAGCHPSLLEVDDNPTPPGADFSSEAAEYASAWAAKEVCTRAFVVQEDPAITLATEVVVIALIAPGFDPAAAQVDIDEQAKRVTVEAPGFPARTAAFAQSQGCIILPRWASEPQFQPTTLAWEGPPADAPWPLGEVLGEAQSPVDPGALGDVLDDHLDRTGTRGIVVVHQGEIVSERYEPGYGPMVPQRGWSTGKSLGATAVGRMVDRGLLALDQPAPVAAWANDERRRITIRNLVNMSSGLDQIFLGNLSEYFFSTNEHSFIYVEGFDTLADAVEVQPGMFEPGTSFAYRNANPITVTAIARRAFAEVEVLREWIAGNGFQEEAWQAYRASEEYEARRMEYELSFLAREVFEPLGMRSSFVETDLYGNFLISGAYYTTPRDMARMALAHLQGGMLGGNRVLSEEWAAFAYAPSQGNGGYGAFWYNNTLGQYNMPADVFFANGGFGQKVAAIPSRDLVVAQLGFEPLTDFNNFQAVVRAIVDVVDQSVP